MQDATPPKTEVPQEKNEPVQSKVQEKQGSKKGNVLKWMLLLAVLVILMIAIGVGAYFLGKSSSEEPEESTGEETTSDTEDEDTEEDDTDTDDEDDTSDTDEEDTGPETLIYTNAYYPSLKITYDDTWTLSETETSSNEGNTKDVAVSFSKSNHTILYTLSSLYMYGGVPQCYKNGELDFTQVDDDLIRIKNGGGYYYKDSAVIKGVHAAFQETFEVATYGEDIADYEVCTFDAPIGVTTSFTIPAGDPLGPGNFVGAASVNIEISGTENATIIDEIDQIVKDTVFNTSS